MALVPRGSVLTFTTTAVTAAVSIEGDVGKQVKTIDFERKEFSNAYLLGLPEQDGGEAVVVKNIVGNLIQFNYNCGSATSIRTNEPDDNNLDNILKSLTIRSWSIRGGPSSPSAVEALYTLSVDHAKRLRSFDAYQKVLGQKISWQLAYNTLRSHNFSYLTNTGLTVTGAALGTESNILIRSFSLGVTHENPRTNTIVAKDWSINFDVITIESQRTYIG